MIFDHMTVDIALDCFFASMDAFAKGGQQSRHGSSPSKDMLQLYLHDSFVCNQYHVRGIYLFVIED